MAHGSLDTTVVGSYPQPGWLIDRDRLGQRLPPRVRARELWRIPEPFLEEAQDDATRLAVRDMERAGIDVVTDGEMRRESYSNRFATALEGVDLDRPGVALDRTGHENPVPRVVGPIRRVRQVEVHDVEFLRSITDRRIKITVPGPFTMAQQAQNDHYADGRSLALAYAEAVNDELRDLEAAGADVVQIDEPYLQARPEPAREYAVEAINRALDGIEGETVSIRASATRTSSRSASPGIRSSASSTTASPLTCRWRRPSPLSVRRCWGPFRTRRSSSASSTWARARSRRRTSSRSGSGRRSPWCRPSGSSSPRTAA